MVDRVVGREITVDAAAGARAVFRGRSAVGRAGGSDEEDMIIVIQSKLIQCWCSRWKQQYN